MVKFSTPSLATDALTGDEEQNGKENKERRNGVPILDTLDHSVSPTTCRGHTMGRPWKRWIDTVKELKRFGCQASMENGPG